MGTASGSELSFDFSHCPECGRPVIYILGGHTFCLCGVVLTPKAESDGASGLED